MSYGTQVFTDRFGLPKPAAANGLIFAEEWANTLWEGVEQEINSGYFLDGFLYLFGEGIRQFDPILEHWSFLFSDEKERWVIGRNAYGALLVLEDPKLDGTMGLVGILDPLKVIYFQDQQLDLFGLIGDFLPQNRYPSFLNAELYQEWTSSTEDSLSFDEILAIKQPLSLDGKMEIANFQVENIVDYYQSTAEVYKKYIKHDQDSSESE